MNKFLLFMCRQKIADTHIRFPFAAGEWHAASFSTTYFSRRAIKIIISIPIFGAFDTAALQLKN